MECLRKLTEFIETRLRTWFERVGIRLRTHFDSSKETNRLNIARVKKKIDELVSSTGRETEAH